MGPNPEPAAHKVGSLCLVGSVASFPADPLEPDLSQLG